MILKRKNEFYFNLFHIIREANVNERKMDMENICVFGSSSESIDKVYHQTAESLGSALVNKGYGVIFGAGKYGVMGATARGVVAAGGKLIGVSPTFFIEDGVIFDDCTELVFTESMRERKFIMEERADAFIICPGGIGTFEEFFEVFTLKQLRRHSKPIIIYNVNNYYNPMIEMMEKCVEQKFMAREFTELYTVAYTEEEVFEQLENYKAVVYDKYADIKNGGANNG